MKTFFLKLFLCVLLGFIAFSCNDDKVDSKFAGNSKLVGSKWTLTYWDYSLGDDYIGLHDETFNFFFYSQTEGAFYYGRKDNYSDQGSSKERIVCHFKYVVNGNDVFIEYITDKYLTTTQLKLSDNFLYADQLEFTKESISVTDNEWLKTVHGTTGLCSWYSDMNGKLWIVGEGAMADYASYSVTPWAKNDRTPNMVSVGEGVTTIGSYAFANPSIIEVEMPDKTLERVGDAAFKGSLIETIWMSQSTEIIGKEAFADCEYLKNINIPENIVSIGEYAFSGCSSLNGYRWEFGGALRSIGDFAFEGCESSYLTFEEGVQSISNGAFIGDYCAVSKELLLPNSLTKIGSVVFEGSYKKIVIGTGTTEIGEKAFISGATSGEMYVNQSTPPSVGGNIIVDRDNWNSAESRWTLYVPKGCKSVYSKESPWNKFKEIIEDGDLEGSKENDEENDDDGNDDANSGDSDLIQDELDENDYRRGVVANGFSEGTGTSSDPFVITSAAELRYFSDAVRAGNVFKNQYIELGADIVINENVLTRYGELNGDGSNFEPWIPIGRYNPSYYFCGTFDGKGYTISGLYCNRPEGENVGFFGNLYGNVKNVIIKDSYFKGKNNVGGIVGNTRAKYISSTIPSSLKEYYQNEKVMNITSCINEAMVTGDKYIGGIVGYAYHVDKITTSANDGYIYGNSDVGGIVGKGASLSSIKIIDCINTGYVRGNDSRIGGIMGNGYGSVLNCLNTGDVKSSGKNVGGICGIMGNTTSKKITNCLNISTEIVGSGNLGAIIGFNNGVTVSSNYYLFQNGLVAVGANNGGSNSKNNSMTESEFKSSDFLNKLNAAIETGWSKWKAGKDGFPILEWVE